MSVLKKYKKILSRFGRREKTSSVVVVRTRGADGFFDAMKTVIVTWGWEQ